MAQLDSKTILRLDDGSSFLDVGSTPFIGHLVLHCSLDKRHNSKTSLWAEWKTVKSIFQIFLSLNCEEIDNEMIVIL